MRSILPLCRRILSSVFAASLLLIALPTSSRAGGILPDNLDFSLSLHSGQSLFDIPMSVAFDGTNYWGASGGGTGSSPVQQYDPISGDVLMTVSSGFDLCSLIDDGNGNLYGRAFGSNEILQMTGPGVFSSVLTLDTSSVSLDSQAPVVLSGNGSAFASRVGNTIQFWSSTDGSWLTSLTLSDYGNVAGEDASGAGGQRDRSLATFGSYYLTYLDGSDEVYAWDIAGNRVGNMVLDNNNGAHPFSFSYSNGRIFTHEGDYHGFEIAAPAASIPEPGAACLLLVGLGAALTLPRRRRI